MDAAIVPNRGLLEFLHRATRGLGKESGPPLATGGREDDIADEADTDKPYRLRMTRPCAEASPPWLRAQPIQTFRRLPTLEEGRRCH